MLTAMGLDVDNGSFPLAYAIVGIENKHNGKYFFHGLVHIIVADDHGQWTFITDRQKGELCSLDEVFPNAKRRICFVHMERNFRKLWPSPQLKTLLWSACYAYTEFEFNANMEQMKKLSNDAFE